MLTQLSRGFRRIIFPDNCLLCRRGIKPEPRSELLCLGCRATVTFNLPPFCVRCSRHLEPAPGAPGAMCAECRRASYHYDRAWGTCLYAPPLRRLIHLFKYGRKTALRHMFVEWMAGSLTRYHRDIGDFDLIIPVPLHTTRLRERGYNQAGLLAEGLGRRLDLPVAQNVVRRTRPTQNQALLTEKERWTNTRAAFKIKNSHSVKGRTILLVDDLLTTGATVSETARALKGAGADGVTVTTLAIAP